MPNYVQLQQCVISTHRIGKIGKNILLDNVIIGFNRFFNQSSRRSPIDYQLSTAFNY